MRTRLALLLAPVVVGIALVGCAADPGGPDPFAGDDIESGPEVDETGDELARPFWFATADTAVCPSGASFDDESGLCVQGGRAIGPFTRAMTIACTEAGEQGCDDANWPLERAKRFRGEDTCPAGATIDPDLGVCAEGDDVFGPFDAAMIDECVARGGGTACGSLRWDRALVAPLPVEGAGTDDDADLAPQNRSCGGLNERLFAHYSTRAGYNQVSRAGLRTLGTRRNGCAAWLSHAIRQAGGTMNVQVNTERFRDELKSRGWTVIRNKADLRPGDVIITKDRKGWRGHPDHVYMFAGWSDRAQTVPLAVDNQGFTHPRNRGKSPIAYGLRAPNARNCTVTGTDAGDNNAEAPQKDSCAGKADGWYCSELRTFSAYLCESSEIAGGWQCADNTVCRPDSSGRATLSSGKPGCFGSR